MTASDPAVSHQVVLQCPACGACESAEAGVLAGSPSIVCRECGETWPAEPPRTKRRAPVLGGNVIDAERRPLVTYSDGADRAWAAKVEGDYWPAPRTPSRLPMTLAGTAALLFLVGFFGGREAAVAALPDLAGLYSAIGMPVNLDGFAIEDVTAERVPAADGTRLSVRGVIRNIDKEARMAPDLAAILQNGATLPAHSHGFDGPMEPIGPGASAAFLLEFDVPAESVAAVSVRFRRQGETLPGIVAEWNDIRVALQ